MQIVKRFALVLAAGLLTAGAAEAAPLGVYTFTGTDPAGDASKPTFEKLTYTSFTRGAGVASSGVVDVFATRSFFDTGEPAGGAPISSDEYAGFSVTVADGYKLSLSQLTFDVAQVNGGPTQVQVAYSTSPGFANPVTSSSMTLATGRVWNFADFSTVEAGTVEFRFYGSGATASVGRQQLDNVSLDGEVVAVPEPAAIALFGLAGLSMLRRRRR